MKITLLQKYDYYHITLYKYIFIDNIMLTELIPIPKTRAGQYIRGNEITVIKERLTSYGSMAIVKDDDCYLVIYWDQASTSFVFSDCGNNIKFLNTLWEEII